MNKSNTGRIGEEIAENYLLKNGYRIIARNYREKFGEIDIVAKAPDHSLVFVEVKTLKANLGGLLIPEDNITKYKIDKVKRTCQFFAAKYSDLVDETAGWRIDVIAVELSQNGAAKIRHYKNIF